MWDGGGHGQHQEDGPGKVLEGGNSWKMSVISTNSSRLGVEDKGCVTDNHCFLVFLGILTVPGIPDMASPQGLIRRKGEKSTEN